MSREVVGKTKEGSEVWADLENSHVITHIQDTPQLLELIQEALPNIVAKEGFAQYENDMGRVIGMNDLVKTEDGDDIVYAKRPLRDTYTRFVKNEQTEPSHHLTIWLDKSSDNSSELITAYIGKAVPPFPDDEFKTPESKPFWSKHALVWGNQEVIPGTETKQCPW